MSVTRGGVTITGRYSQFQHHHHVALGLEGVDALHQLGVVQAVHDVDLLSYALLVLGRISLEELSSPNLPALLIHDAKHLSKLPPARIERFHGGRTPNLAAISHDGQRAKPKDRLKDDPRPGTTHTD